MNYWINNKKRCIVFSCVTAALLVLLILWLLFLVKGYAPFGEKSLAYDDGSNQYLDLFAYLKDVLDGSNSIVYSFCKGPGGGMFGVFSYYLSSPLNILVKAFEKSDLEDFFNLLVSLKLALAGASFALFLNIRFKEKPNGITGTGIVILLSVSYALGQYSIAQSSNVLWLDGVYMLPLILAGVYTLVIEEKMVLLSLAIAASVFFNWYTAGINCIFAGFWLIFETALETEYHENKLSFFVGTILRFAVASLTGLLISGILFLPMVGELTKSSKGSLSIDKLFNLSIIGNFFAVVGKYVPGFKSENGEVSLFCGSYVLLGCFCTVLSKEISTAKRIKFISLLIFTSLIFCWSPFITLFSMFRQANSFWYRYSYTGIFSFIFLAAYFFLNSDLSEINKLSIRCGIGTAFIISYYNLISQNGFLGQALMYSVLVIICAVLMNFTCSERRRIRIRKCSCIILVMLILGETALGVSLQMDNYHVNSANLRREYVQSAEKRWVDLKRIDGGEYRTAQTCTFNSEYGISQGISANFNEPLGFNYRGITSYTSSPEQNTLIFMDNVGYPLYDNTLNEILTPILGVYSLLGVKYVASADPLSFLDETDVSTDDIGGITIYENPYVFPFAFRYHPTAVEYTATNNPFEFQNYMFSELTGSKDSLYYPVDYDVEQKSEYTVYTLDIPEDNTVLYGDLSWRDFFSDKLYVNGKYVSDCGGWLSNSVFYIPVEDGRAEVSISKLPYLEVPEILLQKTDRYYFYAIDLDIFQRTANETWSKKADIIALKNGEAYFSATSSGDENLFVSIPYNSSWVVERNGEEIETELFGDYLYSIPLVKGKNEIHFKYQLKYRSEGIICTLFGLVFLSAEAVLTNKKRMR